MFTNLHVTVGRGCLLRRSSVNLMMLLSIKSEVVRCLHVKILLRRLLLLKVILDGFFLVVMLLSVKCAVSVTECLALLL